MTHPSTIHPARPSTLLRAGVVAATWALPRGAVRDRYRQELLAELAASPPRQRASYTIGVVTHILALRLAVGDNEPLAKEAAMQRKPLTCRLNVRHVWHTFFTEDGTRYRRCVRCGKDLFVGSGPGDANAPVMLG